MSIAAIDVQPHADRVVIKDNMLAVHVHDGRIVSVPIDWYPRLMHAIMHATASALANWRVFEDSDGRDTIFWESLDELIPLVALLAGLPGRESERSF